MALELASLEKWIVNTLLADTALAAIVGTRVYQYTAPEGISRPFVILNYQSGADVNAMGERGIAELFYQVCAYGLSGDVVAVRNAAARIDVALSEVKTSQDGLRVRCHRESTVRIAEYNEGVEFLRIGGLYRFWVG